jgi:hypothetical protein
MGVAIGGFSGVPLPHPGDSASIYHIGATFDCGSPWFGVLGPTDPGVDYTDCYKRRMEYTEGQPRTALGLAFVAFWLAIYWRPIQRSHRIEKT